MTSDVELGNRIAEKVPECDDLITIQPVHIGRDMWRNELLLFIKPELFLVEKAEQVERSIDLVLTKLKEFDAHISGISIVGGRLLDQLEIMNHHYGFINRLSRLASKMLDDDDRTKIAEALEISSIGEYEILGGHEYLVQYPGEGCFDLDRLWFTKKSIKLRSGFYTQSYEKDGRDLILVNGFHPAQLAHFIDPSHRIVLILIHSNTDWAVLRNQMVGATFPEKAVPESIRGTLYAQPEKFGLESVSIANNGVHLSAGPFEAMFEIVNFFGQILELDPGKQPPLILQRMLEAGMDTERALSTLDNPIVTQVPKPVDLFTATEDMDTGEAVAFWKESLLTDQALM
jgi:nucleoside diphosphate kinase